MSEIYGLPFSKILHCQTGAAQTATALATWDCASTASAPKLFINALTVNVLDASGACRLYITDMGTATGALGWVISTMNTMSMYFGDRGLRLQNMASVTGTAWIVASATGNGLIGVVGYIRG